MFLAFFLVTTVGAGLAIYSATLRATRALVDDRIRLVSDTVIGDPAQATAAGIAGRIALVTRQRDTGDIGFELADRRGRHLAGEIHLRRRLPPGFSALSVRDAIAGLTQGRALVRPLPGGMTLTTIAETEPLDDTHSSRLRIFLAGFGAIVATVLAGLVLFGRLVAARIREIRLTVDAIIDGDLSRRVPIGGGRGRGEFDAQALAFNRMLDRIADLVAGLQSVSSDIAHDLRTPLARLRTQLTRIARHAADNAARAEVDVAIAQSEQLLAMFAAVLRIAEVESGRRRAGFAALDLADLAREIGSTMGDVAEERGYRLTVDAPVAVPIRGDRQLLAQAMINLVENALHHTPPGTVIRVSAAPDGAFATLAVSDTGPGIAPDQHEVALRRFGRLDKSRHRTGHGLGLPLIQAIARLHRGELVLSDANPGLRVTLSLPGA